MDKNYDLKILENHLTDPPPEYNGRTGERTMGKGILKSLKIFALCLPFAAAVGVWSGYGYVSADYKHLKDHIKDIEAQTHQVAVLEQELEKAEYEAKYGEVPEYVLSDAYVNEKTDKMLAENEEYAKAKSDLKKKSNLRLGLAGCGCSSSVMGLAVVNLVKDDEIEL